MVVLQGKTFVYRGRCAPRFDLPWATNMASIRPRKKLSNKNIKLAQWYYFWINRDYTDPMVLLRNDDDRYVIHPGQNRWIVASMRYPQDQDVLIVSSQELKPGQWPAEVHSVTFNNVSDISIETRPLPRSEFWLEKKPVISLEKWKSDYNNLEKRIIATGMGCLQLIDGDNIYTLGRGKVLAKWHLRETGIREIVELFEFANSLGWNRI